MLTKGQRWLRATGLSMLCGAGVGAANLASWVSRNKPDTLGSLIQAFPMVAGYAAVTFWIVFPILFFTTVRQNAATLEYQERVRRDLESPVQSDLPKRPPP